MYPPFRVSDGDLLGRGGESEVYALDDARVLRVYKAGAPTGYIERRATFYQGLAARHPGFELPEVLERGLVGGRIYTVERRMRGRAFADALPALRGAERERALASYLETAARIGAVDLPGQPFGELLAEDPVRRDTWPAFLWDRLQQTLAVSLPDLREDVPGIDALLAQLRADLRALEGFAAPRLVHGDYFPGNCFIDETLAVSGVGDFGYTTVAGDPLLDTAGAIFYLEVSDGYRPEDTPLLLRLAAERHGREALRQVEIYRRYCALYFSHCKRDDPRTYVWSVRHLRRPSEPLPSEDLS